MLPQSSETHHAPSIISSRMTDVVSEDGEEYNAAAPATVQAEKINKTAADSIARSGSMSSTQRDMWSKSPASRKGPPGSAAWKAGTSFGGPGMSMSNTSRPQSSMSRSSRTHVPSLTSHAFFRPMSSQRLQAQRAGRPYRAGQTATIDGAESQWDDQSKRHSLGSNATAQSRYPDQDIPPPSRGTEYTEQELPDRATLGATFNGDTTAPSVGDSTRPFNISTTNIRPPRTDSMRPVEKADEEIKPPTSFRHSFLLPARRNFPPDDGISDQGKPESGVSSAASPNQGASQAALGEDRNYQYFPGNTVFCWGGRLQNTNHRPVNVATGVLVVLPSILFLVFS